MKKFLGILGLLGMMLLAASWPILPQNVQRVNYATDGFGILPAGNLPTFGVPVDNVTGTTYPVACGTTLGTSDNLHWKLFSNAGSIAVSVFQAGATGCPYAPNFALQGSTTTGSGTVTITPAVSQISKNGGAYGATATVASGQVFRMVSDVSSSGCTVNGCWDLSTFIGSAGAGTVTSIATTSPITGGTITATGTIACATCVVASSPGAGIAHFAGATQTVTSSTIVNGDLASNAVTSAKMAVVNTRRTCDIAVGDASGSVITNGQLGPQKRMCYVPAASTVVEMDVAADGGTPNVIVAVNHAGSDSNIVSGALATAGSGGIACSNTGGTTGIDGATTCSGTLQNTSVAAGDYLELVSGTAGGVAKLMTIHVIYTVN